MKRTNLAQYHMGAIAGRRRGRMALLTVGTLGAVGGLGWLGLRVPPRSHAPTAEPTHELGTRDLPTSLPEPIERYLMAAVGERLPRIESAVAWGTARMRIGGVWLPARVTTEYVPGRQFERTLVITWFGLPVLKGMDLYHDGHGALTIGGTTTQGPEIDQGESLALWAEGIFMPTSWVADPRVRWEPVDDATARLIVPNGAASDHLLVRVDLASGLVVEITGDRYRAVGRSKEPWHVVLAEYRRFGGIAIPTRVTVTWERDGRPWYDARIDGIAYNVPVVGLSPVSSGSAPAMIQP